MKLSTVGIAGVALTLALANNQSVFSLVILAWSALASAFAPLLIALCLGREPGQTRSLVAIAAGLIVVILWRLLGWQEQIYEGLPGIATGLAILFYHSQPNRQKAGIETAEPV